MIYVSTKKELKEAIDNKAEEFVVTGKLAKKMKGFAKLKKLSKKQNTALIAFLTGSGAVAVAAIAAAPVTGGLSFPGAVALMMFEAPAAGVSVGTILAIIALLGVIGVSVIALLKDYDVELGFGEDLHFKAKKSQTQDK